MVRLAGVNYRVQLAYARDEQPLQRRGPEAVDGDGAPQERTSWIASVAHAGLDAVDGAPELGAFRFLPADPVREPVEVGEYVAKVSLGCHGDAVCNRCARWRYA